MNDRGFTLIEVIVAVAIISIMAGVIMPISYRIWEKREVEETRQAMRVLKQAMVGDPALYQGGIRTDYGFVGDNGELPEGLADLLADSGVFAGWNGPYLAAGFDPLDYDKDAWGEPLRYSAAFDAFGRRVSASLVSSGPDRLPGTADDIDASSDPELQIALSEVTPAADIAAGISYTVSVSELDASPVYYTSVTASYRDRGGTLVTRAAGCQQLNVGLVQKTVPRTASISYVSSFPVRLPVGRVVLRAGLYADAACNSAALVENDGSPYFIAAGAQTILHNLPMLYLHITNGP
jgi:general secretion pathway protein G